MTHQQKDGHKAMCETTYYCFRELINFGKLEGGERLVTPHGDPMEYEYPIDFIFETREKAIEWLREQTEDENIEPEEIENWHIVRVTETVVRTGCYLTTMLRPAILKP
jgi:hypothetical protein